MKKGSFGYLKQKRILSWGKSAAFLASVLILYFAALHHFHTNKNVFSILAAVGALPTGRSIVETVLCMRARSASEKVRDALAGLRGLTPGNSAFDLYLTAYDNAFSLSHAAVAAGCVYGFTEDPAMDLQLCREHIRKMLERDGHRGCRVSVSRDLDAYLQALTNAGLAETGMQEAGLTEAGMQEAGLVNAEPPEAGLPEAGMAAAELSDQKQAPGADRDRAVLGTLLAVSL